MKLLLFVMIPLVFPIAMRGQVVYHESRIFLPRGEPIAEYPGGETAIGQFIAKTLRYPEGSLYKGVKGSVWLSFNVGATGIIADIRLDRGLDDCKPCNDEAVRILKLMTGWKPEIRDGIALESKGVMEVRFEFLK